jgi:hypothetical protein
MDCSVGQQDNWNPNQWKENVEQWNYEHVNQHHQQYNQQQQQQQPTQQQQREKQQQQREERLKDSLKWWHWDQEFQELQNQQLHVRQQQQEEERQEQMRKQWHADDLQFHPAEAGDEEDELRDLKDADTEQQPPERPASQKRGILKKRVRINLDEPLFTKQSVATQTAGTDVSDRNRVKEGGGGSVTGGKGSASSDGGSVRESFESSILGQASREREDKKRSLQQQRNEEYKAFLAGKSQQEGAKTRATSSESDGDASFFRGLGSRDTQRERLQAERNREYNAMLVAKKQEEVERVETRRHA